MTGNPEELKLKTEQILCKGKERIKGLEVRD